MATFTLTNPVRVGDLETGIIIDRINLVAISFNFQGSNAIMSFVFEHASGWTYTITLRDAEGIAGLAALRGTYPNLERDMLNYLIAQGKLPPGTAS